MRRNLNLDKRQHVRKQFKKFRQLCSDLPTGKAHILEGSEYDFPDICIGNKKLGIEFTDFIHGPKSKDGSLHRRCEKFYSEIIQEAEIQFAQNSNLVLSVRTLWSNNVPPLNSQKRDLIGDLLKKVEEFLSKNTYELVEWKDFTGTCLAPYLLQLEIMRLSPHDLSDWANNGSGPLFVSCNELKTYVRTKEKHLSSYSYKSSRTWLVIVASGEANFVLRSAGQNC